jgi:hypothetical protein
MGPRFLRNGQRLGGPDRGEDVSARRRGPAAGGAA